MAYASITYTSASGTTFALTNSSGDPIEYLRQNDISVTVNGVLKTLTTDYTFNTAGTAIVLNTAVSGATVIIARTTDIADATVSFTAGSTLTAQDLNNSDKQNRFALQEFSDIYGALTTGTGDLSALGGFIGSAETWLSDNAHAPTTGAVDTRVDSKIDTALTTDVVAGDSITVTDNSPSSGQITIGVTNASISTAKLVDSSVTTAKIADGNVTTAKILDANVTTAKILDANVTTAKIADNAVTSAKIADGTIVAADLASDSVTTAKILDSNVTTGKINDLAVTTAKLADSSVTSAKIVDGTIVAGDLASDSVTTAKIVDSNVTTAKINDSAVTTGKIADSAVTAIKIADGVITSAKLNAATVVTAAEQAACTPDDVTFFTTSASDGRYVNVTGDSMTGALAMGSNKITGLGTPTANADAATKLYVDNSVAAGVGDADYGDITVSGTGTVWTIDSGVVTSAKIADGTIVDGDISASAEIAVSKLADGDARQLLQTDAAGTGVEWASNIDVPGTLDVTSTATFDSIVSHALGSAAAPTLTFTGDTNTGIYSPGADQVAISTNGTGRLFINSSGQVGVGASPTQLFQVGAFGGSDSNLQFAASTTGASNILFGDGAGGADFYRGFIKYNHSSDSLELFASSYSTISTNGSERLRITSAGLVGIGTSSPSANGKLTVANTDQQGICLVNTDASNKEWRIAGASTSLAVIQTGVGEALRIDSGNRVGIGTSTPQGAFVVSNSGANGFEVSPSAGSGTITELLSYNRSTSAYTTIRLNAAAHVFERAAGESARIDTSGRLLVGTSTNRSIGGINSRLQVEGVDAVTSSLSITRNTDTTSPPYLMLGKSRGGAVNTNTIVQNGDTLGSIEFCGADGNDLDQAAGIIQCQVDGTPGANDMPGRLVFSTTADGASSPTERMRITNTGEVNIGDFGEASLYVARSANTPLLINRKTNDGTLVIFYQDNVNEGNISVSGTTVSYNGAHLSRWSQLPSGAERTEILRGSVLSNIDEMCEWGEEDNEQLNRMKVSDVEGDKNVSGVFQGWDDDDDTYTNDFYCAMTGDFIIRIAEGVTVERGDLLMSAGDGTAKPQDDDIIRSKTIAKVTSTNVSCTYDDGSYCVPCVLMAC